MRKTNKIQWLSFLIELIVVVIGVTIAFMLNSWYENQKNDRLEQKYLNSFYNDISSDEVQLDSLITSNDQKLLNINKLTAILRNRNFQNDSVLIIFAETMVFSPFEPVRTTYESIKSSGNLDLISDYHLKEKIIHYYQTLEEKKYLDDVFNSFLHDYIIPFAVNNIDFAKQRFVNINAIKDYRFENLVAGYYQILLQNQRYYSRIHQQSAALKTLLEKSAAK